MDLYGAHPWGPLAMYLLGLCIMAALFRVLLGVWRGGK